MGQHDLLFVESKKEKPGLEQGDTLEFSDEDVTLVNCTPSGTEHNACFLCYLNSEICNV